MRQISNRDCLTNANTGVQFLVCFILVNGGKESIQITVRGFDWVVLGSNSYRINLNLRSLDLLVQCYRCQVELAGYIGARKDRIRFLEHMIGH